MENIIAVTCCIRYVLDPFKRNDFEEYARRWQTIIPKCGGGLLGYFMPHEGTNNIALALISSTAWPATKPIAHASRLMRKPRRTSVSPRRRDSS